MLCLKTVILKTRRTRHPLEPIISSFSAYSTRQQSNDSMVTNVEPTAQPLIKQWFPDNHFLNVLQIYKSIYNKLLISATYKVPSEGPWPKEFHGYPLGKKVITVRRNENNIKHDYKCRLDTLGFIWNPLEYRFLKADKALKIYKELNGHLDVPQGFVVPSKTSDWPEDLWGYRLGLTVYKIRRDDIFPEKRKYLKEMGFIFNKKSSSTYSFSNVKKCLNVYRKKYGSFNVPSSYTIPVDDRDYPEKMRGAKLGAIIENIIHLNYRAKHHKELIKMGVSLVPRLESRLKLYHDAIEYYKNHYGALDSVPRSFVVPKNSDVFPFQFWGLPLGIILYNIKRRGYYKSYRQKWLDMGIPLNDSKSAISEENNNEKINVENSSHDAPIDISISEREEVASNSNANIIPQKSTGKWLGDKTFVAILKVYEKIYSELRVPPSFIVPEEDPWPIEYHGYPLGNRVLTIRRHRKHLSKEYEAELNKIGFIWNLSEYRFQKADQALKIYKDLHGHLQVPQSFVVPPGSNDWPEALWGYRLGLTVYSIRCSNIFASKRKYFESMGLLLEKKPSRSYDFQLIKECFQIYKKKYATFNIPSKYVIPTNDFDFPEIMRGANLGNIWNHIIIGNQYAKYHNELVAMGMILLPKNEVRFNLIYEAMQHYKEMHGQVNLVPKNFVVGFGSVNFPPHLWGLKLGLILYSIRQRGTYKKFHDKLLELGFHVKVGTEENE